ncbi:LTA synthase family protein [Ferruginibacter sp.]
MKFKFLPASGNTAWKDNKAFILLVLILLGIYSLLKIIFYWYNYHFIFDGTDVLSTSKKLQMAGWSLLYDLLVICIINIPLLFLLQLGRWGFVKLLRYFIVPVFITINCIALFLNLADIFYYRFHFQRANADLLYVLDHPFGQLFHFNFFIILIFLLLLACIIVLVSKLCNGLLRGFINGQRCTAMSLLCLLFLLSIPFFSSKLQKLSVPTYPLTSLNSKQLLVVQNSFHTFCYSVFRNGHDIVIKDYMPVAEAEALVPVNKKPVLNMQDTARKNIVLFIMESVPYDFFDSSSAYKVAMPFFDSLLQQSTFFTHAYCYAHESNKGITAVLAGTPTLTDIPLYHSSFTNMPITQVGSALQKNGYTSFFCIGDDYDNFGFAKCSNWVGIQQYYCKTDIPGYQNMPTHTMGVHDEYVLHFMQQKLDKTATPFFAVNYNVSTHYPYDLPAGFEKQLPAGYSDPMKSMAYYDHSLHQFFNEAKNQSWFNNTVFIFCPDHWLMPDDKHIHFNAITEQHIPVIIFNPAERKKKTDTALVSQFDVLGTILALGRSNDSLLSYGGNLLDSASLNKTVFCKMDGNLYQAIDTAYVLGFNVASNKAEYIYQYKTDRDLQQNLVSSPSAAGTINRLTHKIKAFLQNANRQYHNYR